MKSFVELLTNIRIAMSEIGGTLGLFFLIFYGTYKAWKEFVEKPLKLAPRKITRPAVPRQDR